MQVRYQTAPTAPEGATLPPSAECQTLQSLSFVDFKSLKLRPGRSRQTERHLPGTVKEDLFEEHFYGRASIIKSNMSTLLNAVVRTEIVQTSTGPIDATRFNQKIMLHDVDYAHSSNIESVVLERLCKHRPITPAQHLQIEPHQI